MNVTDFTQHPEITGLLERLHAHVRENPLVISDMIDGEGRQYVDLVQEGGGVWGVALLGYTYILEQMGIRFASMAGTSAGAINTLLLAAAARPEQKRTEKVIHELATKDLFDFVDGNRFARKTISALVRNESKLLLFLRGLLNLRTLTRRLGLNPGNRFKAWLIETIGKWEVRTTADLKAKMNSFPEDIRHRITGSVPQDFKFADIALIAAEVETGTKVKFPYAASLFFDNYSEANPAEYVRASMSIPLFFEPVIIPLPENVGDAWRELGHFGDPPRRAVLVDGGIMSNFPIDVFHRRSQIPFRPTLGVKLRTKAKVKAHKARVGRPKLFPFLNRNFSAARHLRDQEFIFSNPDYKHLVSEIDVGPHKWMNFALDAAAKQDLFVRGARAACDFLLHFDWENYKMLRAELLMKDIERSTAGAKRATGAAGKALRKAMSYRSIPLQEGHEQILLRRIQQVSPTSTPFHVLWIDDRPERNKGEKQLLCELGAHIRIDHASSSEIAENHLKSHPCDLVISDILRAGRPDEGTRFHQRLLQKGIDIPTIFYINHLDRSKGVPPGAFGITNSPEQLLHLVIDLMGRKG